MRPIKYRAWDKERKKWLDDSSWQGHFDDFYFTDINKILSGFGEHVVLMQFTGLLDKNGKEIYEGDIVLIGDIDKPYPVEWDDTRLTWVIGDFDFLYVWEATVNVIGNIHESPELLTH